MIKFNFCIEEDLLNQFRGRSEEVGLGMGLVLRMLIKDYVSNGTLPTQGFAAQTGPSVATTPKVGRPKKVVEPPKHTPEQTMVFQRRSRQWNELTLAEQEAANDDHEWYDKLSDQGRYLPYMRQLERGGT
jgi:hypothetical protein